MCIWCSDLHADLMSILVFSVAVPSRSLAQRGPVILRGLLPWPVQPWRRRHVPAVRYAFDCSAVPCLNCVTMVAGKEAYQPFANATSCQQCQKDGVADFAESTSLLQCHCKDGTYGQPGQVTNPHRSARCFASCRMLLSEEARCQRTLSPNRLAAFAHACCRSLWRVAHGV